MTFEKALEQLKNGEHVRLPQWPVDEHVTIRSRDDQPTLIHVSARSGHTVYRPSMKAIFAIDWELVS